MNETHVKRTALIIGGAGGVGTGIVLALLSANTFTRVIATSRDPNKLAALQSLASNDERLVTLIGGVDSDDAAAKMLAQAETYGKIGAVVSSLGGWWQGADVLCLDDAAWNDGLATLLRPHVIAARTFIPALEYEGARYVLIGGGAGFSPVPGSSLVSIAGAAQAMLTRVIVAERRERPYPIVEEVVIDGPVTTNAAHHGAKRPNEMTAREVGDAVATLFHPAESPAWSFERSGSILTIRPSTSSVETREHTR